MRLAYVTVPAYQASASDCLLASYKRQAANLIQDHCQTSGKHGSRLTLLAFYNRMLTKTWADHQAGGSGMLSAHVIDSCAVRKTSSKRLTREQRQHNHRKLCQSYVRALVKAGLCVRVKRHVAALIPGCLTALKGGKTAETSATDSPQDRPTKASQPQIGGGPPSIQGSPPQKTGRGRAAQAKPRGQCGRFAKRLLGDLKNTRKAQQAAPAAGTSALPTPIAGTRAPSSRQGLTAQARFMAQAQAAMAAGPSSDASHKLARPPKPVPKAKPRFQDTWTHSEVAPIDESTLDADDCPLTECAVRDYNAQFGLNLDWKLLKGAQVSDKHLFEAVFYAVNSDAATQARWASKERVIMHSARQRQKGAWGGLKQLRS